MNSKGYITWESLSGVRVRTSILRLPNFFAWPNVAVKIFFFQLGGTQSASDVFLQ